MYNLYQSDLWREIQGNIYWKKTFNLQIFGREYFWLIKIKKIWPFELKWLQIMWLDFPSDKNYINSELKRVKKIYKKEKWVIFVQLCLLNEIIRFENIWLRSKDFQNDMREMRLKVQKQIKKDFNLKVAFRENMPLANIIYDIKRSDEELVKDMNSWCKERVKKAIKNWIEFWVAKSDQYDLFYKKRVELSNKKWFNVIPKEYYKKLINHITKNNCWNIFISKKKWDIIAWSICIYDNHRIIYLYGFANRKYSNIWWHHYLKFKIFTRARENWMTYVDMLWWAPTWFPEHPLNWVSKFKESLWWTKIEQFWSFDLVISPILYLIFKFYFKIKH